jgi:transposase InsO family protein
MARGFVYLTTVVDWASRKVLAHRVAITMEAMHAVEALEEAFEKYGQPEIVNTDQGSQGEFNRSLQHLEIGGVKWDDHEVGLRNRRGGHRCLHRAGQVSIS